MNRVISDTAEYGCYLFDHACKPLLTDFMKDIDLDVIGHKFDDKTKSEMDNAELVSINKEIKNATLF